jgi:hypothetical protein
MQTITLVSQIFWGPFEIESFINPRKLLMELHWRFSNPRKTIQPEVFLSKS